MGALTLKSFPFVLRSWNVKSYQSFDPTDSFGQYSTVFVNKNQVVKVEPHYSNTASGAWLTDKGRLFFDCFFVKKVPTSDALVLKSQEHWDHIFKAIVKVFHIFHICNFKYANTFFFVLVFENVTVEIINFLSLISQLNSFIKIKRAEKFSMVSDLETTFQINSATSYPRLSASSLCLLVGVNPRYEGSYLNLKLRQRYMKGNFKLLSVGSLIDLTFPISTIGSSASSLKSLVEGNHAVCKDVISAHSPLIITSTEALKHSQVQQVFKTLKHSNIINSVWNGMNVLSSSLYETGLNSFSRFSFLVLKDLTAFSAFYSLNVNLNAVSNIKTLTESRLLKFTHFNLFLNEKAFIIQSTFDDSEFALSKKYLYLPSSTFFENQDSFVNTEGFRRIGSKLIFKKNTKSDWQVLRKFGQNVTLNTDLMLFNDKQILSPECKSLFDFKTFMNFYSQATQKLSHFNDQIVVVNKKFFINKKNSSLKSLTLKLQKTKQLHWLSDFYVGGKEAFCQNSLNLIRCSKNYRSQMSNFS